MTKAKVKIVKKLKVKTKKKIVLVKPPKIKGKLVGRITHYFSDIDVAAITLLGPLNQGDQIRIMGGESTDFNQKVASLQVEHEKVKKAKKGDSVGLKINQKVREGYKVYRL